MKAAREKQLRRLLESEAFGSLDQLRTELQTSGIVASIATVSRDLRRLGAERATRVDQDGNVTRLYALRRERHSTLSLESLMSQFAVSVTMLESLFLLRTLPGCGLLIRSGIDRAGWPEVLATLADDSTVVGICRSAVSARTITERLRRLTGRRRPAS